MEINKLNIYVIILNDRQLRTPVKNYVQPKGSSDMLMLKDNPQQKQSQTIAHLIFQLILSF